MKLGMSTWCLLNSDVYSAVKTIGDARFEFVEIWGEVPHAYHDWVDKRRLRDVLSAYGMTVTMHAPFSDLNPATPFQPVRTAVRKTLADFIEFSDYLGARRITIHPGVVHGRPLARDSVEGAVSTLRGLVREADGRIEINIENGVRNQSLSLDSPLGTDVRSLGLLLRRIERAGLTLDTGHAHFMGLDPLRLYRRFQDYVTEIHLNDNNGVVENHLPPGEGTANLKGLLDALRRSDVFVCLELNPFRLPRKEMMKAALGVREKLSRDLDARGSADST